MPNLLFAIHICIVAIYTNLATNNICIISMNILSYNSTFVQFILYFINRYIVKKYWYVIIYFKIIQ